MTARGIRIAIALLALASTAASPPPTTDAWFRIENDTGDLVGWQHEWQIADGEGTRQIRETVMAYRVVGHEPTRSRFRTEQRRDASGRLVQLTIESGDGRRSVTRRLTVEGSDAVVDDGQGRRLQRFALPPGFDFRDGDALLPVERGEVEAAFDLAPGDLSPIATRFEHVPGDRTPRTAIIAYQGDRIAHVWFVDRNDAGRIVAAEQPLFGTRLHFRGVDGPVPATDLSGNASLPHQMRTSPYSVAPGALRGHIRYRFAAPAGVRVALPDTGEQAVRAEEDGLWRVDICHSCGPGLSTDPADLDRWRQPSRWLQSDAPEIVRAAAPVLKSTAPGADRMARLGRIARQQLADVDYDGHHSALAAWRRRSGDCTEDAVVLAALARAAGIPARVANGLVYSRMRYHGASNAFIAHSWAVAFVDGAWQSFDISTGAFDATHIALTVDDGDLASIVAANQTAALLDWRDMAEVRKRPD
jgi:transglutaminase-like putative cysteine protease